MNAARIAILAAGLAVAGGLLLAAPQDGARALQLAFLVAGAPVTGAVVMAAIARLTGADWAPLAGPARWLPLVTLLGAGAMLANVATPLPPHLRLWQQAAFAAVRAFLLILGLWYALPRLRTPTAAGLLLTAYALLVTPIGADWLLPGEPGHPVSAIGMMLAVQQIGAPLAVALLLGRGTERQRQDWSRLLVAAMLGGAYLAFMDYLIVWYGNLPARVPVYLARTGGAGRLLAIALGVGLGGTIAPLALLRADRGRRIAGACALAALFLFDGWWLGGGPLALAGALALLAAGFAIVGRRAHG